MGGTVSACAGKSGLCAGKEKKKGRKEIKPEKYPKKRKRREKQLREKVQAKDLAVAELKATAGQLSEKLGQHDRDLVDEKIRDSEHRHTTLLSSIDHKLQGYGQLETDLDGLRTEAHDYLQWIDQIDAKVKDEDGQGHSVQKLEARLEEFKAVEHELSVKQSTLDAVSEKAQAILADLPSKERHTMEQLLAKVQTKHNELFGQVSEKCRQLEDEVDLAKEIQERLSQHKVWLEEAKTAAEEFDVIRLASADVDKQLDKCKLAVSKAQNKVERVSEIQTKVEELKELGGNAAKEEFEKALEDLAAQQADLLSQLKKQQGNLRDCAASRRRFEGDCAKVDRWAADTELKCGPDSSGVQSLEERLADLKSMSNTVQVFESLVKETTDLGETFFPSLYAEEHPTLRAQLDALQKNFNRVSDQVKTSTEELESTLRSRSQAQEQVTQCESFLQAVQGEIKKETGPIGFEVKDAELMCAVFQSIDEKLAAYSPTMEQLTASRDKLREDGQASLADDVTRLAELHQTLITQVNAQLEACKAAITQRQAFTRLVEAQEHLVAECEVSFDSAGKQPIADRLEVFKDVLQKLLQLEPDLPITAEKAAHIGTQGTQDDLATATAAVEKLTTKVHAQKANTQAQIAHCEALQREKEGFESSVNMLMTWLEEKESTLASCSKLHLDSAKVMPVIVKHKTTSSEAKEKLHAIREQAVSDKSRYEAMSEPLSEEFEERLQQIEALQESITTAIAKKEQYLEDALSDRQQLENSMHQVLDWLRGASELLDSGVHGLDYDTLEGTLSEFTDYFTEASLCQDELEQVSELSERLMPTLDTNDAATLEQSLASVQRKYTNIMTGAHSKQAHLEQKLKQWNSFQDQLASVNRRLTVLEEEWQEVDHSTDASPDVVHSHLELVKTFLEHAETSRHLVDDLNQVARDLERAGSQDSRAVVSRLVAAVNERWEALTGQAEARVMTLEEIGGQWGDFTTMLSSVQTVIQESETRLSIISIHEVTFTQLGQHLDSLKEINENLERIQPLVSRLQTSSMTLQKALPTAEAKITSQEQFMVLIERYERLVEKAKEVTSSVQEELDTRQDAMNELSECCDWLRDTLVSVQTYSDAGVTAEERLSRNKSAEADLKHRMERVRALQSTLESQYTAEGRQLPEEISEKLEEVHGLEKELEAALREADEKLLQLREDRAEFHRLLSAVTSWLHRADVQLQDRMTMLPQAREDHQTLLGQFDSFKSDLDHLRSKGGEIIRDSPEPEEKQTIQKTLAEVNREWLSLQAQTADRTAALSEAADLSHAIEDVCAGVERWLGQAEDTIKEDLEWTHTDRLREQLQGHRQVEKEVPPNQDKVTALGAMVKQLEQTCPAPNSAARVANLKQRLDTVHTKAGVQLSALEDANQRLTDFEKDVSELMRWLEQTRARMTMRDTTTDLRSQLDVQEKLSHANIHLDNPRNEVCKSGNRLKKQIYTDAAMLANKRWSQTSTKQEKQTANTAEKGPTLYRERSETSP
ncbi:nesprin-1-like [Plakobranchus ocellatus]|uniref:Nesprin-1-like n=1 Tax=Plakobranchus ocellatus TaxID=259542 RepID=A0AAV4DVU1_9GAST|nr:nesprin-1-like [Plakobranchus ocellatus]